MKTMTLKRVKSESTTEKSFNAMEWLRSGREWAVDRILEHHSRKDLIEVMTAVKDAVIVCENEDDALEAVDHVIMNHNFSLANFNEMMHQKHEARKRNVLGR